MKSIPQATPNTNWEPAPKILTVQQVASLLQIPISSVYEKTRTRSSHGVIPPLPCRRVGKYLRFFESEVVGWLTSLPQNKLVRRRRRSA